MFYIKEMQDDMRGTVYATVFNGAVISIWNTFREARKDVLSRNHYGRRGRYH